MREVNLDNKTLKQLHARRALFDKKLEKLTPSLNNEDKKKRKAIVPKTPKEKARACSAEISRIDEVIRRLEA
jgi:hypothetical protein